MTSLRIWLAVLLMLTVQLGALDSAHAGGPLVLRFAEAPHVDSSLVRVGDLVQVLDGHSASVKGLLEVPLGPAPRSGHDQLWQRDDVLRHLELRGVHRDSIRWSGREQVKLTRSVDTPLGARRDLMPAFVDQRRIEQARNNVALAISEYLNARTGTPSQWNIKPQLDGEYSQLLQSRRNIESIGGGEEPWTGEQQFVLELRNQDSKIRIPVQADVQPPSLVVTTNGAIRKDKLLTAEDLTLEPLPPGTKVDVSNFYSDPEEVIGQQARRSISSGLPVAAEYIGPPVVIKRNDVIEVESVSGAIVVRLAAKSLGSGAVGELIEVELPNRKRVHATIVNGSVVRINGVASRTR